MSEAFSSVKARAVEAEIMPTIIAGDQATIALRSNPFLREPSVILTPGQKELLTLVAQGHTTQEIAEHAGLPGSKVSLAQKETRETLGVSSTSQAVVMAIEQGQLDLPSLVPEDFDPRLLEGLTLAERRAYSAIVANNDSVSDVKIAFVLGVREKYFSTSVNKALEKIKARNRTQAIVFFLEARRRKQEFALSQGENPASVDVFEPAEGETSRKKILSEREKELIELRARGLKNPEIADRLGISNNTVKALLARAFRRLSATSCSQAIYEVVRLGELTLSRLVPEDFDPQVFSDLSQVERETLSRFAENKGADGNKTLAYSSGNHEGTIKNLFTSIFKKIRARTREQALVFFLEAKRRKMEEARGLGINPDLVNPFDWPIEEEQAQLAEPKPLLTPREIDVLIGAGKGLTNAKIVYQYDISEQTVKNQMYSMMRKLGAFDRTRAVIKAIELGIIDLPALIPDDFVQSIIGRLSPREIEVLDEMTTSNSTSNKILAHSLGVSEKTVKNHISSILAKTGAIERTQALVFYLEAQRRKNSPLSRRDIQTLSLALKALKGREMTHLDSMKQGANPDIDRIKRSLKVTTLTGAIAEAVKKGHLNSSELIPDYFDPSKLSKLSHMERKVLLALVQNPDFNNQQIASLLGTTEGAVSFHLTLLNAKIDATSRAQAIAFFLDTEKRLQKQAMERGKNPADIDVFRKQEVLEEFSFTIRQVQVLKLAALGVALRDIAEEMNISSREVINQLDTIMWILSVSSVQAAILKSIEKEIIDMDSVQLEEVLNPEEERLSLDPSGKDVVFMVAQGLSVSEISMRLKVPEDIINSALARERRKYRVNDNTALIANILRLGELDPTSLISVRLDASIVEALTKTEIKFLDALLSVRRSARDIDIAEMMLVSGKTVREYMKVIVEKLRARDRSHALVIYVGMKKRIEENTKREPESKLPAKLGSQKEPVTVYVSEDAA